ncbi:MAG: transposase [Caldimicrobium sp.]|nr:transposase [Caldimicrobium sp.]MDW8182267.1 transposase [Caldimicrobium sp.]
MTQEIFDARSQNKRIRKLGRPFKYLRALILFILFFKYALRLPHKQREGFVRALFGEMGISTEPPNFRTIYQIHNR